MATRRAPRALGTTARDGFCFELPSNKGMKVLDRTKFAATIRVPAIVVVNPALVQTYMKALQPFMLHAARFPNVVAADSPFGEASELSGVLNGDAERASARLILLRPDEGQEQQTAISEVLTRLSAGRATTYDVTVDYDYWLPEQILASILPADVTVPASFEQVGHIAHFNLRDEHEPYKHIIGQVILSKHNSIRSVVNKSNTINDTYRTFQMEVLAGDDDMVAELRESNCTFRFDFSKVYWNSRLQGEHERIVKLFKPGEYVCDVFAGVGPFALPAAKTNGCVVFANDLNPHSFEYLGHNIRANKLEGLVIPFNMDGRDFIRRSIDLLDEEEHRRTVAARKARDLAAARAVIDRLQPIVNGGGSKPDSSAVRLAEAKIALEASLAGPRTVFHHYVMNLPATAVLFLDAFRGLLSGHTGAGELTPDNLPVIHVHCFSKADDPESDVLDQISSVLGYRVGKDSPWLIMVHRVRDVAPNKEMMCVSFRLPMEVALDQRESSDATGSAARQQQSPNDT
ncbi:guanine(37)-N1-methyltransferase [Hyaloraphidium curvatum]|nr:guanine(37)-N1-methyltransferase [Hyaloraphidium curvatum]